MNKIWYLSTCDTCTRIIKELKLKEKNFKFIDIKKENISEDDLNIISERTGLKFEDLFNKRAQKYTKTDLKSKIISDDDFRKAILKEYTFLKRPIIQIGDEYFVGNSKKVTSDAKLYLENN